MTLCSLIESALQLLRPFAQQGFIKPLARFVQAVAVFQFDSNHGQGIATTPMYDGSVEVQSVQGISVDIVAVVELGLHQFGTNLFTVFVHRTKQLHRGPRANFSWPVAD